VSSTSIDGRYIIRYAGVTHRTHLDTVRLLLELLERFAVEAEREITGPSRPTEVRTAV
jgi:hypothetical protein